MFHYLVFTLAVLANPSIPTAPYISPFQYCQNVPEGKYCNPSFPRSFFTCPLATEAYCPSNTICEPALLPGEIQCVPNLWNPLIQKCQSFEEGESFCMNNQTVVQCHEGELFNCPSDLVCKKNGRRAYCIQPSYLQADPKAICQGVEGRVCHPTNLKKVLTCPDQSVSFCPMGTICSSALDPKNVKCVPFQKDLERFCSNKPLESSRCLPNTDGLLIVCSLTPQVLQCPSKKCVQHLSITAKCV